MALQQIIAANVLGTTPTALMGGRLTLDNTNKLAVPTTGMTAKTAIWLVPYIGREIALWNSSSSIWQILTIPDAGTSVNLGTLSNATAYDVFAYNNSGTVALEIGPAWTTSAGASAARATAITTQDGTLCKSGDKTRRYLGSFFTTATTTTEDSASNRYLWNYYNRVVRTLYGSGDPGVNHTYTTATWRASNSNTTVGQCRVQAMIGVNDQPVVGVTNVAITNTGTAIAGSGIGVDSTSTNSCQIYGGYAGVGSTATQIPGFFRGFVGIGQHYFQQLEISQATGTTTWLATSTANGYQKGLVVEVMA